MPDTSVLEPLKERFLALIAPDMPNEWDLDEAVADLATMERDQRGAVLDHVGAIWPVSHSLCFDYLHLASAALKCITPDQLSEWVNRTLDQYEKNGLRAAQRYMADVEANFLCSLRGESGLRFGEVSGRLLPYLRGLSGRALDLAPADTVSTDTTTVFVPREMSLSRHNEDNFFVYKLIITFQWACIDGSTFTVCPDRGDDVSGKLWLQEFLAGFEDPVRAADIYFFLETVRLCRVLERELPGLMRGMGDAFRRGVLAEPAGAGGSDRLVRLRHAWLRDLLEKEEGGMASLAEQLLVFRSEADSALDSVGATREMYPVLAGSGEPALPLVPLLYQGRMDLEAVRAARARRISGLKEQFVQALATRILEHGRKNREDTEPDSGGGSSLSAAIQEPGVAMVFRPAAGAGQEKQADAVSTLVVTIDNEEVEAGAGLEQAARDIVSELGFLPEQYISSGAGRAGQGYAGFQAEGVSGGTALDAPITYPEWDYRRGDFRKNWCSLLEKEVPLVRSDFLEQTLVGYRGLIVRLRHQFELMRTRERFVRRQRDGNDIDLDALVESLADTRAGLPPSDRLFVRLLRDERDIAVLFLVDMSNSTQGWVMRVIKESLIMFCEALEAVGDRFGIYGFSGMRRLRSEFFHLKHLDEPYDDAVKMRLASIAPREYTRMGPAVRHARTILGRVEARARLLIVLSDGKPEDYDDYKGEYAIEDTRHALLEGRAEGIHSFCITIDRQAHDYMAHMFGERNYILIDDAARLPLKIPEIYSVLTR